MNTKTLDTKDRQFDYYMPRCIGGGGGGIQHVCHDRHETVPEFILILYDQTWMKIT